MTTWTDALTKEVEQKQEQAIVATHRRLEEYGLTIDTVRAIVKSKSPNHSDDGIVVFIGPQHERLWSEMVNESLESLTADFIGQVHDRLLTQDLIGE